MEELLNQDKLRVGLDVFSFSNGLELHQEAVQEDEGPNSQSAERLFASSCHPLKG